MSNTNFETGKHGEYIAAAALHKMGEKCEIINLGTVDIAVDKQEAGLVRLQVKSSHYKKNIAIVERNGVEDSPVAVDRIYDKLRDINNYYIEEGENEWIRNSGTGRIVEQTQKKRDVQQNYLKELQLFSSN